MKPVIGCFGRNDTRSPAATCVLVAEKAASGAGQASTSSSAEAVALSPASVVAVTLTCCLPVWSNTRVGESVAAPSVCAPAAVHASEWAESEGTAFSVTGMPR